MNRRVIKGNKKKKRYSRLVQWVFIKRIEFGDTDDSGSNNLQHAQLYQGVPV